MRRKFRQLIEDLKSAGFINRGGKGSHWNYKHPSGGKITVSGKLGSDAQAYQERAVNQVLEKSKK
jgi:predicted RNA binding protein YcfA (HicA-like mRNA interferase family)